MSSLLLRHVHALQRALGQFTLRPAGTSLSLLVLGVVLTLPLALHLLLASAMAGVAHIDTNPQFNVFMQVSADIEDARRLEPLLRRLDHVRNVKFVPKDQALEEMKRNKALDDLLSSIEGNPLPHAFIVQPDELSPVVLQELRRQIAALPKVELVSADFEWAEKLVRLGVVGRRVASVLALLLGLAVAVVIGNTIRLQILLRRDEIEVSQLIGATRSFIRRPFLYFGALQGVAGGLIGAAMTSAATLWMNAELQALTNSYAIDFSVRYVSLEELSAFLVFAGILGWVGAFISVSLHLQRFRSR